MSSEPVDTIRERLEELRYLGTQYALNGLPMPTELAEEYQRLAATLAPIPANAEDDDGAD